MSVYSAWIGAPSRPTLAVFALAIVMSVVLPIVNAQVPYHDIVKAGDVCSSKAM